VARHATRYSKEFIATVISLITTAFGVVVALAWNSALTTLFTELFGGTRAEVAALFIYAVVITGFGVAIIMALARLATRLDAQPVEFKYPAKPKDEGQPGA